MENNLLSKRSGCHAPLRRPALSQPILRLSRSAAGRLDLADRRSRELGQLLGRPDRAAHQLAAAVRAPAFERDLGARAAERALERADHRVRRIRRQVAVAALAARSQLQREPIPSSPP
jgi:hypothetical protein